MPNPRAGHFLRLTHRLLAVTATATLTAGCATQGVRIQAGLPLGFADPPPTLRSAPATEAYFEIEISDAGEYTLAVADAAHERSAQSLDTVVSAVRWVADKIDPPKPAADLPHRIGTDTFDALAGVVWSVYRRNGAPATAPAEPSPQPAARPSPKPTLALAAASAQTDIPWRPAPGVLGPEVMQSAAPIALDTGRPIPERARLEPGRYVIRVVGDAGRGRPPAERFDIRMVRLVDGAAATTTEPIRAVPYGALNARRGQPTEPSQLSAPPPPAAR
jgi:hypothetical protein